MLGYGMVSLVPYSVAVEPLKKPGRSYTARVGLVFMTLPKKFLMCPLKVRLSRRTGGLIAARKLASSRGIEASSAASEGPVGGFEEEVAGRDPLGEVTESRVSEVPRTLDGRAALLQGERVRLLQVDHPPVLGFGCDDAQLLTIGTDDGDASELHGWDLPSM